MQILWRLLAGWGVFFHLAAFAIESLFWMRPAIYARFGATAEQAEVLRVLFFNQGFYNLFLALGCAAGIALAERRPQVGRTLVTYSCLCMSGAGLVLLCSVPEKLAGALLQGVPPLLAVATAQRAWRAPAA